MNNNHNILTTMALRLTMLLLMTAGGSGAWGQSVVTAETCYPSLDGSNGGTWISANTGRYTVTEDGTTRSIRPVGLGDNGTRVYTTSTAVVPQGISFILEFDFYLKGGTDQPSWLQVNDAQNIAVNTGDGSDSSVLLLSQNAAGSDTWTINGESSQTVTLDTSKEYWHHLRLVRTQDNTYLSIYRKEYGTSGNADYLAGAYVFSEQKITTLSTTGGLGNIELATKRYSTQMKIDGLKVTRLGWDDNSLHTISITNAGNDNKVSSGLATFYTAGLGSPTFTYDGIVAGNFDKSYPPRLIRTGMATATAKLGDDEYSYSFDVTASTVTGTYTAATRSYSFDQVGVLAKNYISDVPFITMTFDGGPTAVVVEQGGKKVLKVIDWNGYSHPFDMNSAYPTLGTFYRFNPSASGTLTINGNYNTPILHTSSNKTNLLTAEGSNYTATLQAGTTYYLYNSADTEANPVPLLHSFSFTPTSTSITFRNAQSSVTVDIGEGSYTNPAISAEGKPITYSIASGAASVDAEGKVTFNSSNYFYPAPITVLASDGSASISYTINLVKHTWIFNQAQYWTTTDPGTTHWNSNGTDYVDKTNYEWENLKIGSGSDELPETKGLLFNDGGKSPRIYIKPGTDGYIATRATTIAIDDVKAGQTVTVDWYANRGDAVMSIAEAGGEQALKRGGGITSLTATADGRMTLVTNASTSYIRSISISTAIRAIGSLNYDRTVLPANGANELFTGYSITDESGVANLNEEYNAPTNFQSSNPTIVDVNNTTGELKANNNGTNGLGVAVITATATAKNSATHQPTVTLTAIVEVVGNNTIRVRTINIEDLMYNVNVSAADGLDRRIPGFDLTFTGGDGAKCNSTGSLLLRQNSGQMTITPRAQGGETVYITRALLTVKAAESGATFTVNPTTTATPKNATAGGIELTTEDIGKKQTQLVLKSGSNAGFEIVSVKIYYQCGNAENADYCLDDTKVSPQLSFATDHFMRIPSDGRAFTQTPTLTPGDYFKSFNISYTFTSSNTTIATINADGTGGQLRASGQTSITARFSETTYFAEATAKYNVSNTLLPGEQYDDIRIDNGQFIHISAKAGADETALTLSGTAATSLTYGTEQTRHNTYANANGSVTLTNNSSQPITIYWVHVVKPSLRTWLYYAGQEENYMEQVQFAGFQTGNIAGFRVMDMGDPDNPIDITDAYSLTEGSTFTVGSSTILSDLNNGTGNALASAGSTTISHSLTKTGQADGYVDVINATTTVNVLTFDKNHPVTWSFINNVADANNTLGTGWIYDDRGFQYGYFVDYTPIMKYTVPEAPTEAYETMHGVMLKDEFRWYSSDPLRGLRANLSQPKASIKFPVKKGMEIVINVASSSADVSNTITNVTDVNGGATNTLYIQDAGDSNPINAYFLAASDGVVELKSADKVGIYLKSITLRVPKIHFTDDITTVLTTDTVVNEPINIPSGRNITCTITSASKFDSEGNEEVLSPGDFNQVATIDDDTKSIVSLKGQEGIITVHVVNNDATGIEANEGDYTLHIVDFRFDPNEETINLDDNFNKEKDFSRRPLGINKVGTPINYSFEIDMSAPYEAKAMMSQSTNVNPALTTYLLTAYNKGTINVIAQTGRITTTCTLTVEGHTFQKSMDALSENEIPDNSYTYTINLPQDYNSSQAAYWTLTYDYEGEFYVAPVATANLETEKLEITNLYGTSATQRNHGAIRVTATHNNGTTSTTDDDNYTQFVLTLSYPASSGKKWDFYRSTTGLKAQANYNNKIADYVGTHLNEQTVPTDDPYVISGYGIDDSNTDPWTTNTFWKKIYRNGDKEPRWAYTGSVKCDNAFIIEETAGLQIETPKESFYVDNNATASYCHIGLHSHSTVTIPKLKQGDFVRLNMSRVIPNNGAIIEAKNVTDLAGTPITEKFTITRSQIDYKENGVLATDENGSRIIPGYYTFIVANDGDASFTLSDEGYLDLLSVEIYDKDAPLADTYLGTKAADGYQHTMTKVKLSSSGYPFAPTTMLKENDAQELVNLSFCHPMWSTSVGPCDYILRGVKPITDNLNATMENIGWYSGGGAYYVDGLITVNEGYGKITVRMNNYTAEGKYLIGYTPDYTLTVGHLPHQDYPYTWNFTNISGGAVKGDYNNAYNSVNGDDSTWGAMDDNVFQLDTDTEGGSFYVPGATLVSTPRDLGMKGTKPALDAAGTGCDEFNGLGVQGRVMFKAEEQASAARSRAPRRVASVNVSLLDYSLDNPNYTYGADLPAGNGTIKFGANKREVSNSAACGYGYKLDGDITTKNTTKYALLTPMRPLQAGDIINIKAFCTSTPNGSDYGVSIFDKNEANYLTPKTTIYIPSGRKGTEVPLTYTVATNDGIEGLSSIFIIRANGKSTYISEVSITGTVSTTLSKQMLYTVTPTTITIPDLNANGKQDWIYIKASKEPTAITNATKVTSGSDGPDAATGVYKYKVTAAGKSDVTFNGDTEIDQIGVTHILKQMTQAGDKAWATESRDHSIDHSLTGYFTQNDVNAYTVTMVDASSTANKGTVRLNAISEDGYVPEMTGLVLRSDDLTNFPNTNGYSTADAQKITGNVPLFYPAMTTGQTSTAVDFPTNNLMYQRAGDDADNAFYYEESPIDGKIYYKFILAKRYKTWRKDNGVLTSPSGDYEYLDAAVFYRFHKEEDLGLNTLGKYKAYLLLPSDKVPPALWNTSGGGGSAPHRYIAIEGVSDMEELEALEEMERTEQGNGRIYNLRGQMMQGDVQTLPSGIYIKNGKKIMIR